eukprot:TRINITY_DN68921_c0_g1_i1.p2 TRINITY_DN68921_c0_g1~~TRINITY_DN68921_c0_g1_i1.p2  ORF type:complete len:117 (-),score=25.96 TRINITY_DN68921_c0_g1_i1:212-562(-)
MPVRAARMAIAKFATATRESPSAESAPPAARTGIDDHSADDAGTAEESTVNDACTADASSASRLNVDAIGSAAGNDNEEESGVNHDEASGSELEQWILPETSSETPSAVDDGRSAS